MDFVGGVDVWMGNNRCAICAESDDCLDGLFLWIFLLLDDAKVLYSFQGQSL